LEERHRCRLRPGPGRRVRRGLVGEVSHFRPSHQNAAHCAAFCFSGPALQSSHVPPYRAGMYTIPNELAARLRLLTATGAVLAAAAVALSAYAAHAAQGSAQASLYIAAILTFGHGIALVALAPRTPTQLHFLALCGLLLGTLLFSGSLELPVRLAPLGGSVLILSWLLYAVAALRR